MSRTKVHFWTAVLAKTGLPLFWRAVGLGVGLGWLVAAEATWALAGGWLGQSFPPTDDRQPAGQSLGAGGRLRFPPSDDRDPTERTTGGGNRAGDQGHCPASLEEVPVILRPNHRPGRSSSGNPMVYVYVPPSQPTKAEVTIADETGEEIARYRLPLSGQAGILRFPLFQTSSEIPVGKKYIWSFVIICDPSDRSIDRFALAQVQHDSLPSGLSDRLAATPAADVLTRAELLAQEGFWYDALELAVALRLANPQDPNWASLLESVKLDEKVIRAGFIDLPAQNLPARPAERQ